MLHGTNTGNLVRRKSVIRVFMGPAHFPIEIHRQTIQYCGHGVIKLQQSENEADSSQCLDIHDVGRSGRSSTSRTDVKASRVGKLNLRS
jgi:hypothetical protein